MNRTFHRRPGLIAALLTLALLVTLLAAPVAAQDGGHHPRRQGEDTLALLGETIIPERDRIDLARRLLGVTDIPEPPTTPPPELELGAVRTFWVDNLDNDYEFQVDAELIYKTDHIYVFYEVGQAADWEAIKRSTGCLKQSVLACTGLRGRMVPASGDPHLVICAQHGNWVAASRQSIVSTEAVATSNGPKFLRQPQHDGGRLARRTTSVLAHEFQHGPLVY